VASLACAVILSRGRIFALPSLYPWVCFSLALGTAAFRFPRAGGCTIIFVLGLFAVWICVSFLSYPGPDKPDGLSLYSAEDGHILIRKIAKGPEEGESWNIEDDGKALVFEVAALTAHPSYPLVGGEQRGSIVRISRNGTQLFSLTGNGYRFRFSGGLGFSLTWHTLELPTGALLPGVSLSVLFDSQRLYFDPPIQL
jgi:hypothetical protein